MKIFDFIMLSLILTFSSTMCHKSDSGWEACSVSCGRGIQRRTIASKVYSRPCHMQICPGVLGWPRIHFEGRSVVNTATINNNRCFYNNKYFPPFNPLNYFAETQEIMHKGAIPYKTTSRFSVNPTGDHHYYFTDVKVTALCYNATDKCHSDSLVGKSIENLWHGRMADIDVDYQSTPEIFGLTIHISGCLQAKITTTQAYGYSRKVLKIEGDEQRSVRYKANLYDIEWFDPYYKKLFGNPQKLSFTMTMDAYRFKTKMTRIVGTIGKTSPNDPVNAFAGRTMFSPVVSSLLAMEVPFYFHKSESVISLDFSQAIKCNNTGNYSDSKIKKYYKILALGLEIPQYFEDIAALFETQFSTSFNFTSINFHQFILRLYTMQSKSIRLFAKLTEARQKYEPYVITAWRKILFDIMLKNSVKHGTWTIITSKYNKKRRFYLVLTKPEQFKNIFETNGTWYLKYAGTFNLNVGSLSSDLLKLISSNTMAFLRCVGSHKTINSVKKGVSFNTITNCSVIVQENTFGLNVQSMNGVRKRMAKGDVKPVTLIATQYGVPLHRKLKLSIIGFKKVLLSTDCRPLQICGTALNTPNDVLVYGPPKKPRMDGTAKFLIKAVKSPGNVRGCNIDGQIYLIAIKMEYYLTKRELSYFAPNHKKSTYVIYDLGSLEGMPFEGIFDIQKQCHFDDMFMSSQFVVLVFSNLPENIMKKKCPSWSTDIQPIFQFYYNMFPVMSLYGLIDLRSRDSLRKNLRMLNMSMFEFPWEHPNFMPTSRDLSPDKTEIIRRWIECEAAGLPETEDTENTLTSHGNMLDVCGTETNWNATVKELQSLLQSAILIEWYTVPPYLTAWFSIQTGRSQRAADILKSVYVEEMLHMSLAANTLNAIGGNPNLTDVLRIPRYPTYFPSHDSFQIRPDLKLTLEPYSKAVVEEVFVKIEEPAPVSVQWIIAEMRYILDLMQGGYENRTKDCGMRINEKNGFKNSQNEAFNRLINTSWENLGKSIQLQKLFDYSTDRLKTPEIIDSKTVGGFYTHIMLKILQADSCRKLSQRQNGIFTGNPNRQLNMNQWYVSAGVSSGSIFPVYGINSAIKALLTIVYEGEGATMCSPNINSNSAKSFTKTNLWQGERKSLLLSPTQEKTHYIRFKELAAGREVLRVTERKPEWSDVDCFTISSDVCNCLENSCPQYCFIGKDVNVPKRSIWPMIRNARKFMYAKNTRAKFINTEFNNIYTAMLRCIEKSFNGHPENMNKCSALMKELQVYGKQLSKLLIYDKNDSRQSKSDLIKQLNWDHAANFTGPNATPTWTFKPYHELSNGAPLDPNEIKKEKHVFC